MKDRCYFWILLVGLCVTAACRRDDTIRTYRLAKEPGESSAEAMPMLPGMAPAANARDVQWKVPKGWTERPASAMRVGSFQVLGADGKSADVSVIPLSGEAGGDLANINRWRGQIQLKPFTQDELEAQSEIISPGGRRMRLVDFANAHKRLLAAIYVRGQTTWFFKMMGDDATVEAAKPDFRAFLKSLRFTSDG